MSDPLTAVDSAIIAERQTIAKVSDVEGWWDVPEGGDVESTGTEKEWDAGASSPDILTGRRVTTDLTVRRPYRPARDRDFLVRAKARVNRVWKTIQVYETDPEYGTQTLRETHRGVLIAARGPKGNARNSTAGTIELVFAIKTTT